jgi:hypothetical protein
VPAAKIHDPHGTLSKVADIAGTQAEVESERSSLIVTNVLDDEILSALRGGASVLCLVDSNTVAPAGFPLTVISRDSGFYDGNWASMLNWVNPKSPVIGWLPTAPRMGFAPSGIGLPFVLGGLTADWMPDVHAGMFLGWLHSSSAYIVQMGVGAGKLLLCTIPVAGSAGDEPFATRLYGELVRCAASESMQPHQSWNPR